MLSPDALHHLGLRADEPVRFVKPTGGRRMHGRIAGIAADGSITVFDRDGAARSLRPDRVEVRRPGASGRLTWRLISEVTVTWEQLELW
jgi:hypothetical protein